MTRKGVWNLQQVRDKYLQELWTNDISFFSWGDNDKGVLGHNQGTPGTDYSSPTQIPGADESWEDISNGNGADSADYFKLLTKTDGTLWAWGDNGNGGLGQNSRTNYSSPVQVGSETTWGSPIAMSTGQYSSYVIKSDGTLWVWGNGNNGQLGDNSIVKKSSPVQVPGTNWSDIVDNGNNCIATKTDGTLWTWGKNSYGELGHNNTTRRSSPTQVPGTNWNKIDCNYYLTAATKTDGTFWIWGDNYDGELGQNNRTTYSSPRQVPGTTWDRPLCGRNWSSGIKTDGTLWTWGRNETGVLGHNENTPGVDTGMYSSPVQVGTETTWDSDYKKAAVAAGAFAAIKTDGTFWTWGTNSNGQLGHNDRNKRSSPTQVPGTKWREVYSGYDYFFGKQTGLSPSQL